MGTRVTGCSTNRRVVILDNLSQPDNFWPKTVDLRIRFLGKLGVRIRIKVSVYC